MINENINILIQNACQEIYEENNKSEAIKTKLMNFKKYIFRESLVDVNDGTGIRTCQQIKWDDKYIIYMDDDKFLVSDYYYNQIDHPEKLGINHSLKELIYNLLKYKLLD